MRMPKVLDLAIMLDGENLISTNAKQVFLEEHSITSLSVSIDSKFFIVNLNSQEIHLRDVAGSGKAFKNNGGGQSVNWNPKRPLMLASASNDHIIHIRGSSQANNKIQPKDSHLKMTKRL
ncbi:hypothetical protein QQP08_003311, partial [Theobroma cacao]